jgi:hypothetical protein
MVKFSARNAYSGLRVATPNQYSFGYFMRSTSGLLEIFELGQSLSFSPSIPCLEADQLEVRRTGSTVKYFKNGTLLRTAPQPYVGDLVPSITLGQGGRAFMGCCPMAQHRTFNGG